MKLYLVIIAALGAFAIAHPTSKPNGSPDEAIVYPNEKLYAEEYKRDAKDADEAIVYPNEKLYAEEYKRDAKDADEAIVYPNEKLYAEEY